MDPLEDPAPGGERPRRHRPRPSEGRRGSLTGERAQWGATVRETEIGGRGTRRCRTPSPTPSGSPGRSTGLPRAWVSARFVALRTTFSDLKRVGEVRDFFRSFVDITAGRALGGHHDDRVERLGPPSNPLPVLCSFRELGSECHHREPRAGRDSMERSTAFTGHGWARARSGQDSADARGPLRPGARTLSCGPPAPRR